MSTLIADSVTKRFDGVTALDDVSLEVRPGEIHGLIGPNGSGKTTLLNLLSGFYRADAGEMHVDGASLTATKVERRSTYGIARTFQRPRLLNSLTVLENAMIGGWRDVRSGFIETAFAMPRPRREERELRERATELLRGVGLGYALDRPADMLDHAEQRFLEIARGLAQRARYILLDEPAGGLTDDEIEHLGAIITTIRDNGIGVLLVEHHTDFVFRFSDRVAMLNLGKVIKYAKPDDVRRDPEVIRIYLGE